MDIVFQRIKERITCFTFIGIFGIHFVIFEGLQFKAGRNKNTANVMCHKKSSPGNVEWKLGFLISLNF